MIPADPRVEYVSLIAIVRFISHITGDKAVMKVTSGTCPSYSQATLQQRCITPCSFTSHVRMMTIYVRESSELLHMQGYDAFIIRL